jgi:hypothetical protein
MALSITLSGSVSMLNGIMLNVLAQIYLIEGSGFCFSDDDHDQVSECDGQKPSLETFQNLLYFIKYSAHFFRLKMMLHTIHER